MREIEIEFKNILTKEQLETIKASIDFKNYVEQTNIYFETRDLLLKKNNLSLRIRVIGDRYYLMLKDIKDVAAIETNEEISRNEFEQIIETHKIVKGEVKDYLKKYNLGDLTLDNNAQLTTYRYFTDYKDCILFLDENHYYGQIDYELELETTNYDYGKKVMNEIILEFSLTEKSIGGKKSRAYNNRK